MKDACRPERSQPGDLYRFEGQEWGRSGKGPTQEATLHLALPVGPGRARGVHKASGMPSTR